MTTQSAFAQIFPAARMGRLLVLGAASISAVLAVGCKPSGPTIVPKIGETVSFDDSDWVVVSAVDLGKHAKANNSFAQDKTTEGKFVEVDYKVTSKQKEEDTILDGPKLTDGKGREFKHLDDESFYIPAEQKTIVLEKLPPSMTKEFWTVFEVPADAADFKFQARSLGLSAHEKPIALGTLQAAPPSVASGQASAAAASEGSAVCARARACCEALSPKGTPGAAGCSALTNAPDATCEASVNSFKQAATRSRNKAAQVACK